MDDLTGTSERTPASPHKGTRARWPALGLAGRSRSHTGLAIPQGRGTPASMRRDGRYRRLLGFADLVSVVAAAYAAIALLGESDSLRLTALAALPVIVLIGKPGVIPSCGGAALS